MTDNTPRPVIAMKDGEVLEFPSIRATEEAGFNPKRVADVLAGRRNTHKKYHWMAVEQFDALWG